MGLLNNQNAQFIVIFIHLLENLGKILGSSLGSVSALVAATIVVTVVIVVYFKCVRSRRQAYRKWKDGTIMKRHDCEKLRCFIHCGCIQMMKGHSPEGA